MDKQLKRLRSPSRKAYGPSIFTQAELDGLDIGFARSSKRHHPEVGRGLLAQLDKKTLNQLLPSA